MIKVRVLLSQGAHREKHWRRGLQPASFSILSSRSQVELLTGSVSGSLTVSSSVCVWEMGKCSEQLVNRFPRSWKPQRLSSAEEEEVWFRDSVPMLCCDTLLSLLTGSERGVEERHGVGWGRVEGYFVQLPQALLPTRSRERKKLT